MPAESRDPASVDPHALSPTIELASGESCPVQTGDGIWSYLAVGNADMGSPRYHEYQGNLAVGRLGKCAIAIEFNWMKLPLT